MKRQLWTLLMAMVALLALAACADNGAGDPDDKKGGEATADFLSAAAGTSQNSYDDGKGNPEAPGSGDLSDDEADEAAREIVEADVFKVVNNTIYVLNYYRGLAIIDMSNPVALRIVGRQRLEGTPTEMYLENGIAVILTTGLYAREGERFTYSSRVISVDVSDPASPTIANTLNLEGSILDSRLISIPEMEKKIVYIVSSVQPWMDWCSNTQTQSGSIWLVSLNISDPSNIYEAKRQEMDKAGQAIYVTGKLMYVASAEWNYWDWNDQVNQSTIQVVDLSDPDGQFAKRGSFKAAGFVQDRFKMYEKDDVLSVVSNSSMYWNGDTTFETFNVSNPDVVTRVGHVTVMNDEALKATQFSGDRAYIVTFRNTDPLFVVDFSAPAAPVVLGNLVIPGWSTHLEIRGDRVYGVGIDNTDNWKVKVALFDVSDPTQPGVLASMTLGEGYSYSEANWDWKAFKLYDKVIGDDGLMLVPTTEYGQGWGPGVNKLNLIQYSKNNLTPRGSVISRSPVRRGFLAGDYIASLSYTTLQLIDYKTQTPTVLGESLIAAYVGDLYRCGQVLCSANNGYYDQSLDLRLFDPAKAGDTPYWMSQPLEQANTGWGGVGSIIYDNQKAYVTTMNYGYFYGPMADAAAMKSDSTDDTRGSRLHVFDLSDATSPRFLASTVLEAPDTTDYWYSNTLADRLTDSKLLAVTHAGWKNEAGYTVTLNLYNVADPLAVTEASKIYDLTPLISYSTVKPIVRGSSVWVPDCDSPITHEGLPVMRCYATRIDASNPADIRIAARINVPGMLIGVSDDQSRLYTLDRRYGGVKSDYYTCSYSLEILEIVDGHARRLNSVDLYGQDYCYYVDYANDDNTDGDNTTPSANAEETVTDGDEAGYTESDGDETAKTDGDSAEETVTTDEYSYFGGIQFDGERILASTNHYSWTNHGNGCYSYDYTFDLKVRIVNGLDGQIIKDLTIDNASQLLPVNGGGALAVGYDYSYGSYQTTMTYLAPDNSLKTIPLESNSQGYYYYYSTSNPVRIDDTLYIPLGWEGIMATEL